MAQQVGQYVGYGCLATGKSAERALERVESEQRSGGCGRDDRSIELAEHLNEALAERSEPS